MQGKSKNGNCCMGSRWEAFSGCIFCFLGINCLFGSKSQKNLHWAPPDIKKCVCFFLQKNMNVFKFDFD